MTETFYNTDWNKTESEMETKEALIYIAAN
jgi:hypothetical protein